MKGHVFLTSVWGWAILGLRQAHSVAGVSLEQWSGLASAVAAKIQSPPAVTARRALSFRRGNRRTLSGTDNVRR